MSDCGHHWGAIPWRVSEEAFGTWGRSGIYSLTLPPTGSGWTLRTLALTPFLADAAQQAACEPRRVCGGRQVLEVEAVIVHK